MADIDVVRKRTNVWPWIIGLLLIALVIWALFAMMTPATVDEPVTRPVSQHPAEVSGARAA